jgi:hypothetical protein
MSRNHSKEELKKELKNKDFLGTCRFDGKKRGYLVWLQIQVNGVAKEGAQ